jgi:hypothetical protein
MQATLSGGAFAQHGTYTLVRCALAEPGTSRHPEARRAKVSGGGGVRSNVIIFA